MVSNVCDHKVCAIMCVADMVGMIIILYSVCVVYSCLESWCQVVGAVTGLVELYQLLNPFRPLHRYTIFIMYYLYISTTMYTIQC